MSAALNRVDARRVAVIVRAWLAANLPNVWANVAIFLCTLAVTHHHDSHPTIGKKIHFADNLDTCNPRAFPTVRFCGAEPSNPRLLSRASKVGLSRCQVQKETGRSSRSQTNSELQSAALQYASVRRNLDRSSSASPGSSISLAPLAAKALVGELEEAFVRLTYVVGKRATATTQLGSGGASKQGKRFYLSVVGRALQDEILPLFWRWLLAPSFHCHRRNAGKVRQNSYRTADQRRVPDTARRPTARRRRPPRDRLLPRERPPSTLSERRSGFWPRLVEGHSIVQA